MRRRLATLLSAALLVTVIGVFAPSSPASANPGVCAGALGTAGTGAPLTYPVTVVPNPGGPSVTVTVHQPVTTGFGVNFTTGTCVNTTGLKGLGATGTVSGWCGHSSGQGSTTTGERFAWVSAGSLLILTGGLTGVVNAVPDPLQNQTCNANKGNGASKFLVSGVAIKTHCNVGKTKVTPPTVVPPTLRTVDLTVLTVNVHTGQPTYTVKVCLTNGTL